MPMAPTMEQAQQQRAAAQQNEAQQRGTQVNWNAPVQVGGPKGGDVPGIDTGTRENQNRKKPPARTSAGKQGVPPPPGSVQPMQPPPVNSWSGSENARPGGNVAPPPPAYPNYPYPGQTVIPMAGVPTHVAEPNYWPGQQPGQDAWGAYTGLYPGVGLTAEQAAQQRAATQQNYAQQTGTPVDWNANVIVPGPQGTGRPGQGGPAQLAPTQPTGGGGGIQQPVDQGGGGGGGGRGRRGGGNQPPPPVDPNSITNLLNTGGRSWQGSRIYDMPDAIQQRIFQSGRGQILSQLLGALGFQMGGYQGQYGFPSSWIVPEGFSFGPEVGALLAQLPDIDRQNLMDFLGQQFNIQIDQSGNPLVPTPPANPQVPAAVAQG